MAKSQHVGTIKRVDEQLGVDVYVKGLRLVHIPVDKIGEEDWPRFVVGQTITVIVEMIANAYLFPEETPMVEVFEEPAPSVVEADALPEMESAAEILAQLEAPELEEEEQPLEWHLGYLFNIKGAYAFVAGKKGARYGTFMLMSQLDPRGYLLHEGALVEYQMGTSDAPGHEGEPMAVNAHLVTLAELYDEYLEYQPTLSGKIASWQYTDKGVGSGIIMVDGDEREFMLSHNELGVGTSLGMMAYACRNITGMAVSFKAIKESDGWHAVLIEIRLEYLIEIEPSKARGKRFTEIDEAVEIPAALVSVFTASDGKKVQPVIQFVTVHTFRQLAAPKYLKFREELLRALRAWVEQQCREALIQQAQREQKLAAEQAELIASRRKAFLAHIANSEGTKLWTLTEDNILFSGDVKVGKVEFLRPGYDIYGMIALLMQAEEAALEAALQALEA